MPGVKQPLQKRVVVSVAGLTRPSDARLAVEAGAWAVGVVFDRRDPRKVTAAEANAVLAELPREAGRPLRLGTFRNQSPEVIKQIAAACQLDLIELAGHEPETAVRAIGPERVIKRVVLHELTTADMVLGYSARYLQLDKAGSAAEGGGVHGLDPGLARELAERAPRLIIGGTIDSRSLGDLLPAVRPWGVSLGRGVEERPGVLDPGAFRAAVEKIRQLVPAPLDPTGEADLPAAPLGAHNIRNGNDLPTTNG